MELDFVASNPGPSTFGIHGHKQGNSTISSSVSSSIKMGIRIALFKNEDLERFNGVEQGQGTRDAENREWRVGVKSWLPHASR